MTTPLTYRNRDADECMAQTRSVTKYLPRILAYPLGGFCLPVILMVMLFTWIGVQSLFGIPMLVITAIWTLHYLLAVVENTARGHATPPPMSGDVAFLNGAKTVKALLVPALVMTAYFGLAGQGAFDAARWLLVLCGFVAPAYLLTLAVEDDLVAAVNPLRWLQTIFGMGWSYLLPCVMLALALAALTLLTSGAGIALLAAAFCYGLFVTGHLLGFVAYHRHEALGLDVEVGDPKARRDSEEQAARLDRLMSNIDACLARQDIEAAARALLAEPGGPASLLAFHEDLFARLGSRGAPALYHAQGRRLIAHLLAERRDARALEVFEACENRHPGFAPDTPQQALRLAQAAFDARYDRLALKILSDIEQSPADDAVLVTAGFLAARVHSELRRDDAQARALLVPLLVQTAHPLHRQITAYHRALASLQQRT